MEIYEKNSYALETILVGSDIYCQNHYFFRVIGSLKSGTPKLELLDTEKSKESSDPTYHDYVIKPVLNDHNSHNKTYYTPRWSAKMIRWQIKIDNVQYGLRVYDPNIEYHVSSYY